MTETDWNDVTRTNEANEANEANETNGSMEAAQPLGGWTRSGVVAIATLTAVAGASAAIGAERIDRAVGGAELVAGLALFASALLAVVVCLARTRIEIQREEIENLRTRALDAEIRAQGVGAAEYEWMVDRYVVRESER